MAYQYAADVLKLSPEGLEYTHAGFADEDHGKITYLHLLSFSLFRYLEKRLHNVKIPSHSK